YGTSLTVRLIRILIQRLSCLEQSIGNIIEVGKVRGDLQRANSLPQNSVVPAKAERHWHDETQRASRPGKIHAPAHELGRRAYPLTRLKDKWRIPKPHHSATAPHACPTEKVLLQDIYVGKKNRLGWPTEFIHHGPEELGCIAIHINQVRRNRLNLFRG